ncbi:MAG: PKD domain-containing protein [Archangium sp.]
MQCRGAFLLLVTAAACVRAPHVEKREQPIEAGLVIPFVSDSELTWDFGDGSAPVVGSQVEHAFQKRGSYVVRGRSGSSVREEISVEITSRSALHLVPPDVEFAIVARGLEDLPSAFDFGERLGGPQVIDRALESVPAIIWAVDQTVSGGRLVDPREGVAAFAWPSTEDSLVSVVGVVDPQAALSSFSTFLEHQGWSRVSVVLGLARFENEFRALDVFVDRGALYAVDTPLTHRLPSAQARIQSASSRGLEAQPAMETLLDDLPAGGLVFFARAPESSTWSSVAVSVRIDGDELRAEGMLAADAPLWTTSAAPETRLLQQAPEGPVVAISGMSGVDALASMILGPAGSSRRLRIEGELAELHVDLTKLLDGFAGGVDALAYADVQGFVRATAAAGGQPRPRASVLLEAPVRDAKSLGVQLDALLGEEVSRLKKLGDATLTVWRGEWNDAPLDVALTEQALFAKSGAPVDDREPADLLAEYTRRFDGAFGPGHVSVLLDIGRLRSDLLQPHLMDDVDPRKALAMQALAVTVIDRVTQLDLAMADLSPSPRGAKLQVVLRLRRPRESR